ncbi:MAG: zinc ribbon domain-containing protein [Clostridia bacterium]|nr:zinc ribbon domain-containing protein [Clostridia bacterium]
MAFLDNIGSRLSALSQEALSQVKLSTETVRFNSMISDEERQINGLFIEIGKKYFEANKDNPSAEYADIIDRIKDAQTRIGMYKDDIRKVKGMKTCPQCGCDVAVNAMYCSNCGAKVPADVSASKCSACGTELDGSSEYCPTCGAKVNNMPIPSLGVNGLGGNMVSNGAFSTPNMYTSPISQPLSTPTATSPQNTVNVSSIPMPTNIPSINSAPTDNAVPKKNITLKKED